MVEEGLFDGVGCRVFRLADRKGSVLSSGFITTYHFRRNIHKILANEEAVAALENYEMQIRKNNGLLKRAAEEKNRINRESDRSIRTQAVQPV